MDIDVIIVGAGPTGLMLAGELCLAGVRPLVLERARELRVVPRANGVGGQVLELLRYRGLLERFEAAVSGSVHPAPIFPFGNVHVDFTSLPEPPLRGLPLPQPRLEQLLDGWARGLGAEVRRGHEIVEVGQDDDAVTAEVVGPDGPYRVTAPYLVGCDGGRSRVREAAGISFPGTTYPEVNRIAQVMLADSVTVLDGGDLDVPGLGRIERGFTRSERGVFALGSLGSEILMVSTTEDEDAEFDDAEPMTLDEFQGSVRRLIGAELPVKDVIRLSRFTYQARQAGTYRAGRIFVAGDAAHLFPATGVGLGAGMIDAVNLAWKLGAVLQGWVSADLLDTYQEERHYAGTRTMLHTQAQVALRRENDQAADALRSLFSELLVDEQPLRRIGALIAGDVRYPLPGSERHPLIGALVPDLALHTERGTSSVAELLHDARPVFLDLADRPELRDVAQGWKYRVDIRGAKADQRPADALLIRPDGHVAWAAGVDEDSDTTAVDLHESLVRWFGAPEE